MEEEWRPVVGFKGLYEVSDRGRVQSLDRTDTLGRLRRGALLTGGIDGKGYRVYALTAEGRPGEPQRSVCLRAHVLVLTAFVEPCPAVGMQGCHNNDVPNDNRRENLRWDTPEANAADRMRLRTGLTSEKLVRPRTGRRRGSDSHCGLGHRLVAPNLTRPQPSKPRGRCLACQRAHNTVNDARRLKGGDLDLRTEANRHYARIMGGERT